MPKTIFSRPDWEDTATRWGTYWTGKLIEECPTEIVELYKEDARRAPNEAAIKKDPASLYYGFGHGNSSVFTGQNLESVIDNKNIALWDQAFVHLLSCEVFAALGLLFKHGGGYNRTYYFYISTFPDGAAEQYYRSDHATLRAWWRNASMAEARAALKQAYTDWFAKGLMGNDYLPWDRDSYIVTGGPDDRPGPISGIKKVTAYYVYAPEEQEVPIGDMTKGENDIYSLKWKFPKEGVCRLKYDAEDTEGNRKAKETGDFTIKFPESPIEIVPIWPVGGEVIEAKAAEIKTQVRYLG